MADDQPLGSTASIDRLTSSDFALLLNMSLQRLFTNLLLEAESCLEQGVQATLEPNAANTRMWVWSRLVEEGQRLRGQSAKEGPLHRLKANA